jgi:predicted MPP superfamily phosphohydrolase
VVRAVFFAFLLLALLGDARIFLFVINHIVFGNHRQERSRWHWLLYVAPPLLLALTALFWPLNQWIERLMETRAIEQITPERLEEIAWSLALAKLGATWLIVAAGVGSYWILERIRVTAFGERAVEGARTLESDDGGVDDLEITRHEVFIDGLAEAFDGYRIVFLTDAHVAPFVRRAYYDAIRAQVRRIEPDLILFGGDFVTFRNHIPLLADRFAGLGAKDGMYAVLGNHDHWSGAPQIIETLGRTGVRFLSNAHVMLARGGARLPLAGIDEVYRGTPDPDAAFSGIGIDQPCLAFTHHPDLIDILPSRRIDLLLCGHTHGGQIRFPFFGAVVVPSKHEATYASGFHRVGPVLMYVSRGIGAIPPVRILCRPEIATFVLRHGRRS